MNHDNNKREAVTQTGGGLIKSNQKQSLKRDNCSCEQIQAITCRHILMKYMFFKNDSLNINKTATSNNLKRNTHIPNLNIKQILAG